MTPKTPTLHMLCGKIASGKSSFAEQLGRDDGTVVLVEDVWLAALYPNRISSSADFLRYSGHLRTAIGPHVVDLLKAGLSVVLDFQANTLESRAWLREILDQTRAADALHWFDVPDAVCLERLRKRNDTGDHPFAATQKQFHLISRHFVEPTPEEGFTIIKHGPNG